MNNTLEILQQFIAPGQFMALRSGLRDPESGQFFQEKITHWCNIITTMPHTYQTEEQAEDALVYLHYFHACGD